jgi:hypothetical protein
LSKEKHIVASCVINKQSVYKNGSVLFVDEKPSLQDFLVAIYDRFAINYPKFYKMDNLSKLGFLASEILLKDENLLANYQPEEIAVVLTNSNASLDADIKYFDSVKDIASPALFVYTLPNIIIGEICIRNNVKGENAFFVFNNFNADFIETYVNNLMDNHKAKLCICGWVDVLQEDYNAALFLIDKNERKRSRLFTKENMQSIFERRW